MSRLRTGHTPDAWTNLGPETPSRHRHRFASVPVLTGPSMMPALTMGGNFLPGREAWKLPSMRVKATIAAQLDPQPRPVCGAILRTVGTPCARTPGHRDTHRSAEALRDEAVRRRARRPSRAA